MDTVQETLQGTAPRILARMAYPTVMTAAFVVHQLALYFGLAPALAVYGTTVLAAGVITALERWLPYRRDWRPSRRDARADVCYLVLVQMALPALLAMIAVESITALRGNSQVVSLGLWPHEWPAWAQVALVVVVADFLRYWLHRACHRVPMLWRLHAIHHHPDKLYWANVGRFHPLEKTLQLLLDSVPFALLGVQQEVLALYFLFYAVNGFFQHSNVDMSLSGLNRVLSTADLHRWHHARERSAANVNFGNNLIIWDSLFGTRYLPARRQVQTVGTELTDIPGSFSGQVLWPFGSDRTTRDLSSLLQQGYLRYIAGLQRSRLLIASRFPRWTQRRVLRSIMRKNRRTSFGRRHGFAEITAEADYRGQVAVQTYDSLRPYIERQLHSGDASLTREQPAFYAQTSGTTSKRKLIPLTCDDLARQQRAQRVFAASQFAAAPNAYRGKALAIVGAAVESQLPDGRPVGSASGLFYRQIPSLVQRQYVVPWQVFQLEDYDLKYLLIARLALAEANITHIASANPSTLLRLIEIIREHRCTLLQDVLTDRFSRLAELDSSLRALIQPRLAECTPDRRRALRTLLDDPQTTIGALWPRLHLATTWTGGSCSIALSVLRDELPSDTQIADPGYLASEFRGTIPLSRDGDAIPAMLDNYYEFVERELWDAGQPEFRSLAELRYGQEYYPIVTTRSGLYRYFINDVVKVTGWVNHTPSLTFVRKGNGVTSLCGEKVTETQARLCVENIAAHSGLRVRFYLVLCREDQRRYELLLQLEEAPSSRTLKKLCNALDHALQANNVEYAAKRQSGRLLAARVRLMSDRFEHAYRSHCVEQGQRESQLKPALLQYERRFAFDYRRHAIH